MKNDSSRDTFDAGKHYSSVRMQQGRVQVDADWNEQGDIITHRVSTVASDVIGRCGGPWHDAAFHIVADAGLLTAEEQARPANKTAPSGFKVPDFLIGAGRYYVDGILCENARLTSYLNQPDLPDGVPPAAAGLYIVYLDVWQRHLTALDDPSIREIALGGPDTTTRLRTTWQVKYWFGGAAKSNCATAFAGLDALTAAGTGMLSARTTPAAQSTNPCVVPPGAGYRGLENQLYRVEVHDGGDAIDAGSGGAGTLVTRVQDTNNQVKFTGGTWVAGQAIEIFSSKSGSDPMNGTLAYVTAIDAGAKTLTLNVNVSVIAIDELRVRPAKATYKWSRDNGAIVTTIESINGQELTVHDLGPDAVLGFKEGQWAEIIDDGLELNGRPGQLGQISAIDRAINLVTLNFAPTPLAGQAGGVDPSRHPKLRRWDGIGAIKHLGASETDFVDLEDGVQVQYSAGTFKTGDYWTIAARTATADTQSGNIEWPKDGAGKLVAQLPFGVAHHYCRLAILQWDGTKFTAIEDCRDLFPPITELTSLLYVSGDGQEAMPGQPIPQLLQAGVFNGQFPIAGARVRFVTADPVGRLATDIPGLATSTGSTFLAVTGADGVASCAWKLDPDVGKRSQQVEARLLDANGDPQPGIVRFNGNLSIAAEVFYDPGGCETLAARDTVQKAIDQLSHLVSLYEVSGNNLELMPGAALLELKVLAANRCGPADRQKVRFTVATGAGTGSVTPAEFVTGVDGLATATWTLDPSIPIQMVDVTLVDESAPSITAPTSVRFTANLSIASQVAYTPGDQCPELVNAKVKTVQEALDELCSQIGDEKHDALMLRSILLLDVKGQPLDLVQNELLLNAFEVRFDRFAGGIAFEIDGGLPDIKVRPFDPIVEVELDLPYPTTDPDRLYWVQASDKQVSSFFGFQRVRLDGGVELGKAPTGKPALIWKPTKEAVQFIQSSPRHLWGQRITTGFAGPLKEAGWGGQTPFSPILCRIRLRSALIWVETKKGRVYLNAEHLGTSEQATGRELLLKERDPQCAGDLDIFIYLVPDAVKLVGPTGRTRGVRRARKGAGGNGRDARSLAPFYPTPPDVVARMLEIGQLEPGERLFDLGSGDGRIVIAAARQFGADATGFEHDKHLWRKTTQEIKRLSLQNSARTVLGDATKQDVSGADLVTLYLGTIGNARLRPMLETQLKPGARVVSHDYEIPGWRAEKMVRVEDADGRGHTLFAYRR